MEAAEKPSKWEGESSGSEVDPDDLLTEDQKGGLASVYVCI